MLNYDANWNPFSIISVLSISIASGIGMMESRKLAIAVLYLRCHASVAAVMIPKHNEIAAIKNV